MPRPPPDRPPKRCADCPVVLPDPRATRCAEHSAARRKDLKAETDYQYRSLMKDLAARGARAWNHGGEIQMTEETAREVHDAARRLDEAVRGLTRAQRGEGWQDTDPDGRIRIKDATVELRIEAEETVRLLRRVLPGHW